MNWFEKMCRDLGLMVHNLKHTESGERKVIKKQVEQEKRDGMILRRTTIEEIEIKKNSQNNEHGS